MFILIIWFCFSSYLSKEKYSQIVAKKEDNVVIFTDEKSFKSDKDGRRILWRKKVTSSTCGIDNSPVEHVYEGVARIETYPWLGILYYPHNKKRFTTAVVLVTRQMVLATALEIDKLPKDDFRARARVVVGHNCSAGPGIGIRDYTFHPDYSRGTFSAIALVQLEIDHVSTELRPICPPPRTLSFHKQEFYAKVFSEDCNRSKMSIHKMIFVSTEECKTYYRRAELDIETLWPTYTACARSVRKGHCVWRSGAVLVMKVGSRWSLLGFGVYGPGCEAPARFLDYGMYHEWVQRSIERIGRPAITKIAPNYIVLRRSLSNVQRFGPCDEGEVRRELYTESTEISRFPFPTAMGKYYFNLTIIGDVEYSCIVLRADYNTKVIDKTPKLHLTRYCTSPGMSALCFSGVQFIEIKFYVEIEFVAALKYSVAAYGRTVKAIDPFRAHKYANKYSNSFPLLFNHNTYKVLFSLYLNDTEHPLYGKKNMTSRAVTEPKNETKSIDSKTNKDPNIIKFTI